MGLIDNVPDTLQEQHDVALLLVVQLGNVLVGTPVGDQVEQSVRFGCSSS